MRLSVIPEPDVRPCYETVASEYGLRVRVPYDKLPVRILHGVKFVYVHGEPASSSRVTERLFTETADFFHDIGRVMRVNYVYLVVAFVGVSEFLGRSKLRLEHINGYRVYDSFHFFLFLKVRKLSF